MNIKTDCQDVINSLIIFEDEKCVNRIIDFAKALEVIEKKAKEIRQSEADHD